ncbi:hypothetical protein WJX74_006449 [Apatococcus lobatus]|uniref:Glycosyl transferase family 25 domain-containing protein n=1 Tax=Apatococcus lobatus TaxID=904363 RepID=A0AAW1R188_9CHLO
MDDLVGKVVVINLTGEPGRYAEAEARLRATGTTRYERLEAVDGREMGAAEREAATSRYCRAMCTPSMVGCFLSHLKAWRKCVDEGLPSVMVLEDDVMFTGDATAGVRTAFRELPPGWDLFYLGCFTCDGDETTTEDASIARMLYPSRERRQVSEHLWTPTMIFGMHAYVVSAGGARKLAALMPRASNHVDWELSRHLDELAVYALRPGVAYQTGMDTSSMGSKAPVFANRVLANVRLGTHESDGRTLAWLCSEGWGRLGHDRIVVNKYFVVLFVVSAAGLWRWAAGCVAADFLLACAFLSFSKTANVAAGYATLLLAVALGAGAHLAAGRVGGEGPVVEVPGRDARDHHARGDRQLDRRSGGLPEDVPGPGQHDVVHQDGVAGVGEAGGARAQEHVGVPDVHGPVAPLQEGVPLPLVQEPQEHRGAAAVLAPLESGEEHLYLWNFFVAPT